MKFLVDAQLPRRMTAWLTAAGCDAVHTLDLPDGNRTTDEQINGLGRPRAIGGGDQTLE
jgi:predicted nuclease of predicted toxin-antitoxin system